MRKMAAVLPKEPSTTISYPETTSFVIEWTIPNFSSLKREEDPIDSDGVAVCKSTWFLRIYPADEGEDTVKGEKVPCIGVFLKMEWLDKEFCRGYQIFCKGTAIDITTGKLLSPPLTFDINTVYTSDVARGYGGFSKHSDIWGSEPTLVLSNDTLKLRAEIQCTLLPLEAKPRREPAMSDSLREKYRKMYNSFVGRDFTLVCADGIERKVHKVVMDSSSAMFHSMFKSKLVECEIDRYVMQDVSTVILDEVLRFVYYGSVENVKGHARDLLKVAVKYEIPDLNVYCEDALINVIGLDNVVDLLYLADTMSATKLKQATLQFLIRHYEEASTELLEKITSSGKSSLFKELVDAAVKMSVD